MRVIDCAIWCLISFAIGTFFGVMILAVLSVDKDYK